MVTPCSIHKIILGFDQTTWLDSNRGCVLLQTTWFDQNRGSVSLQTTWFDPNRSSVSLQTIWFDPNRSSVSPQTTWFDPNRGSVSPQTTWFDPNRGSVSPQTTWFDPNRGPVSRQTTWIGNATAKKTKKTGCRMIRRGVSSCNGPAFHFSLLSSRTPSRPCHRPGQYTRLEAGLPSSHLLAPRTCGRAHR